MEYYFKYNEINLTNIAGVRAVEMPALPSMKHSSIDVFERDGNIYNGSSYNNRDIKITFIVRSKNRNIEEYNLMLNDVKRAFYTKEEARLFCGNKDMFIWCVPTGDLEVNELTSFCAECEINLIAYDPYWYNINHNVVNNNDDTSAAVEFNKNLFIVDNGSDVNVYPTISIGFTQDTTFCQVANNNTGEKIMIGGFPSTEGTYIKKNAYVFVDQMETTTGWTSYNGAIDNNRSKAGSIALTSDGSGIMAGDYGSASSGATWHGPCYSKSLDTPVKDFKVRIRMGHKSSGTNGDPTRPYENQDTTVSGTPPTTYYKVNAKSGLRVRKGASTKYAKIGVLPYGTHVYPSSISNGWAKITYNGKTGYCYATYLTKCVQNGSTTTKQRNYVTNKNTAIRASASETATCKITVPAGTVMRMYYDAKYPTTHEEESKKEIFFKTAKAYSGQSGYILIDDLVEADDYEVTYDYEYITADDKTGVIELYGYSSNNVQLFKLSMVDDNPYYEFTYPLIKKNGSNFLVDKTVAPNPKTRYEYNDSGKVVEKILSGSYGDWNDFYGELYIERINNVWYAYVQRMDNGVPGKIIKSSHVTDTENKDEELSYLVMYVGTTNNSDKASDTAITYIEVKTATDIDNTIKYNVQEFEVGDIVDIDTSIPEVRLNGQIRNDLVDIGSTFFALEPGENTIKVSSDDVPNVDVIWINKFL